MSRRVSLPGADELFRSTREIAEQEARAKGPSGRVRHDEKITVYVTADELHDLEATRLLLRRDHRVAVDRGRIVREAIHLALEAVQAEGEDSPLVRRLREQ